MLTVHLRLKFGISKLLAANYPTARYPTYTDSGYLCPNLYRAFGTGTLKIFGTPSWIRTKDVKILVVALGVEPSLTSNLEEMEVINLPMHRTLRHHIKSCSLTAELRGYIKSILRNNFGCQVFVGNRFYYDKWIVTDVVIRRNFQAVIS